MTSKRMKLSEYGGTPDGVFSVRVNYVESMGNEGSIIHAHRSTLDVFNVASTSNNDCDNESLLIKCPTDYYTWQLQPELLLLLYNPQFEKDLIIIDEVTSFIIFEPETIVPVSLIKTAYFCQRKAWLDHVFGTNYLGRLNQEASAMKHASILGLSKIVQYKCCGVSNHEFGSMLEEISGQDYVVKQYLAGSDIRSGLNHRMKLIENLQKIDRWCSKFIRCPSDQQTYPQSEMSQQNDPFRQNLEHLELVEDIEDIKANNIFGLKAHGPIARGIVRSSKIGYETKLVTGPVSIRETEFNSFHRFEAILTGLSITNFLKDLAVILISTNRHGNLETIDAIDSASTIKKIIDMRNSIVGYMNTYRDGPRPLVDRTRCKGCYNLGICDSTQQLFGSQRDFSLLFRSAEIELADIGNMAANWNIHLKPYFNTPEFLIVLHRYYSDFVRPIADGKPICDQRSVMYSLRGLLDVMDLNSDNVRLLIANKSYRAHKDYVFSRFCDKNKTAIADLDASTNDFIHDIISTKNYFIINKRCVTQIELNQLLYHIITIIADLKLSVLIVARDFHRIEPIMDLLTLSNKRFIVPDSTYEGHNPLLSYKSKELVIYNRLIERSKIHFMTYKAAVNTEASFKRTFNYCILVDTGKIVLPVGIAPMFRSDKIILVDDGNETCVKESTAAASVPPLMDHIRKLRDSIED